MSFAKSAEAQRILVRRGISPHDIPKAYGDNIVVLVGKTGSGKDVCCKYILRTMQKRLPARVISFCGTAGITAPIPGATELLATEDSLKDAIAIRKAQLRSGQKLQDQIWVLNDVTATNISTISNGSSLSTLCTESRHLKIRIVIMMQYLNCISQVIKNQASLFLTLQATRRTNEFLCKELGFSSEDAKAATRHGKRRFHPTIWPALILGEPGFPLFLKPFPAH